MIRLVLTDSQLISLAEISRDIAQVVLAASVVEPIVARNIDWLFFIVGLLLSFIFWSANLFLIKKVKL